jgi:integrase/recombinase XerD
MKVMMNKIEKYLHQNLKSSTADRYYRIISHFIATHPKAKFYQYKDIVNHMAKQKKSYDAGTCNTMLAALKKYYDYLLESGLRNTHPCRTFSMRRKRTNIQVQNLFTASELEELLNRPNRYADMELRNKVVLSLLIYQGLTCDELIRLNVTDIDLNAGTVYIKASRKLKSRKIEIHRTQFSLLSNYLNETRKHLLRIKGLDSTGKLLIGKTGEPLTQDGIKALFKPLKHFFPDRVLNASTVRQSVIASLLNQKKFTVLKVQELSGMRYPSSAERYRSKDVDEQRKLINQYHPLK